MTAIHLALYLAISASLMGALYMLYAWLHLLRDHDMLTVQVQHLRNLIDGDHRWLAHDPSADALTTRRRAALAADWRSVVHESSSKFCARIGLEPDYTEGTSFAAQKARLEALHPGSQVSRIRANGKELQR